MTIYYYVCDVSVAEFIGCGIYKETVYRTVPLIEEIVGAKNKPETIRDNFTEDYFNVNKEALIQAAITKYNKNHNQPITGIVGIRRAAIMEMI